MAPTTWPSSLQRTPPDVDDESGRGQRCTREGREVSAGDGAHGRQLRRLGRGVLVAKRTGRRVQSQARPRLGQRHVGSEARRPVLNFVKQDLPGTIHDGHTHGLDFQALRLGQRRIAESFGARQVQRRHRLRHGRRGHA
mmetsp:Transcript_644/g.1752  ORF Transcript_644/g.1752 Transcript_644/m.1752 type:complete len:139 (+) Transcript_644:148-564(+)